METTIRVSKLDSGPDSVKGCMFLKCVGLIVL